MLMPHSDLKFNDVERTVKSTPITHNLMWKGSKWEKNTYIHRPNILSMTKHQQRRENVLFSTEQQESSDILGIRYQFEAYLRSDDSLKKEYEQAIKNRFETLLKMMEYNANILEELISNYTEKQLLVQPFRQISNKEELAIFLKELFWLEQDFRFYLNNAHLITDAILVGLKAPANRSDTREKQAILQLVVKINSQIMQIIGDYDKAFQPLKDHLQQSQTLIRGSHLTFKPEELARAKSKSSLSREKLSGTLQRLSKSQFFKIVPSFMAEFQTCLIDMVVEANKLPLAAKKEAQSLQKALQEALTRFTENEIGTQEFSSQCEAAIKQARPILEKHAKWSNLLDKILFIVGTVFTLGLANLTSKITSNRFRFHTRFHNDTPNNLDNLEQKLQRLQKLQQLNGAKKGTLGDFFVPSLKIHSIKDKNLLAEDHETPSSCAEITKA